MRAVEEGEVRGSATPHRAWTAPAALEAGGSNDAARGCTPPVCPAFSSDLPARHWRGASPRGRASSSPTHGRIVEAHGRRTGSGNRGLARRCRGNARREHGGQCAFTELGPSGRAHRESRSKRSPAHVARNASLAGDGREWHSRRGGPEVTARAAIRRDGGPGSCRQDGVRCDTRPRGRGDDGTGRADRGSRVSSSRRQPNARHGGRRPSACGCSRGSGIPRHAG